MSPDNHQPRKRSAKKGSKNVPEFRFINHSLSKEDQEQLAGYLEAGEYTIEDVFQAVESGYAFKLSPDSYGGGYRSHFICLDEASADFNACLAGRGATPIDAIYALLYRHLVLAPDGWSQLDSSTGSPKQFG